MKAAIIAQFLFCRCLERYLLMSFLPVFNHCCIYDGVHNSLGFTACRCMIDAILALRLLSEIHREFEQPLTVAYLDIKAAFDSVDRQALHSTGVPVYQKFSYTLLWLSMRTLVLMSASVKADSVP